VSQFSSRLAWPAAPNRLSELLAEKRIAGAEILDLTETNPTKARIRYPDELLQAFNDPGILRYEPAPAGMPAAREAVAAQCGVPAGRVFLTASTSEAYAHLFKLVADPGDSVLVPRPSYPLFEFLASLESVRVAQYRLRYDAGWSIDFDALTAAAEARTRAVVVVNPNNPTGSFLKRREAARLLAFCAERNLAVISDEVFAEYGFSPDEDRVTTLADCEQTLTFCLGGLSKLCGLPQMKLGWILTGGPPEARAAAFERLEWIADTYLSVGAPVQCAAGALLSVGAQVQTQIAARTAQNLAELQTMLAGSPCNVLPVEGGWCVTVRVPHVCSEEDWCLELLERDNVAVQPGYFYDFESEAFLVLSLLTPREVFVEGVRRLRRRADALS
jgi:aspartate/methionine/tyrosine aminotransferase